MGVRPAVVAVVMLAVVVAGAMVLQHRTPDRLTQARHLAGRDDRFSNGPKAGTAFADLSHLLLDDAKACAKRHSASDNRCAARYSAAAYTSVAAFALVGCTQPGVFRARQALLTDLSSIMTVDRRKGAVAAPPVPGYPSC